MLALQHNALLAAELRGQLIPENAKFNLSST